ncbi:MAG: CHRD domain-containing protein [Verrucomicrobia bacterium]|nr:CHRD domain-containing protein [Verrucomicrobiota bacterium]
MPLDWLRQGDTDAAMRWTGGVGPFVVQTRPSLAAPGWINGPVVLTHDATVAMSPDTGFVRVMDIGNIDPIGLSCYLRGELERPTPVVVPAASGFGLFRIEGNNLVFDVRATGLTGKALAAHIHGPAGVDETAPPMIDLAGFAVGDLATSAAASGTVPLSPEQKAAILNGRAYVNFHTEANRDGEIRGQIVPVLMESLILGHEETPQPIATPGFGSAGLLLVGNQLSFNISYHNLTGPAIAAHIHGPAAAGESAGVLFDLSDYKVGDLGVSGAFAGTITLTPAQLSAVAAGRTYINVHTPDHQGGEARGQVLPHLTATPLTTLINGDSERPTPIVSTGSGLGILRLENDELRFDIAYKGLSAAAMAGHFHGPAKASASTNVVVDLTPFNGGGWGVNGSISGYVKLVTNQITAAKTGLLYVNLHTPANPQGEIRGQIVPSVMQVALDPSKEIPSLAIVGIGSGIGSVILAHDNLSLSVDYRFLSGVATAAHIHGPGTTSQSVGVLVDIEPLKGTGGLGISGGFGGAIKADAKLINAMVDGLTYVNVHTANNKNGEIRGQITR